MTISKMRRSFESSKLEIVNYNSKMSLLRREYNNVFSGTETPEAVELSKKIRELRNTYPELIKKHCRNKYNLKRTMDRHSDYINGLVMGKHCSCCNC
jgi:hypothetical protein